MADISTSFPAGSPLRSPFASTRSEPAGTGAGASHAVDGTFPDVAGRIGVRIQAHMLPSVTLLSTWISGLPNFLPVMRRVFLHSTATGAQAGQSFPEGTGQTLQTPLGLLARTGPEEFLLIDEHMTPGRVAELRQSIPSELGSVTDLSHARCRIRIEGEHCRTALNKLFALDLRDSAFPIGQVQLSGTHHVPGMLYRTGSDAFDWIVFTTYAQDQLETLADAAMEYGVEIKVGA